MGANSTYVTGVGGFGQNAEGTPDAYVGAANTLRGAAEMTASVMFLTRPNYTDAPADEFLFGNLGASQGWAIRVIEQNDVVKVQASAEDSVAGAVNVARGITPGGVHIATLALSDAGNILRVYVNGSKNDGAFANAYVPSTDRPTIGVAGPTPLASSTEQATNTLIIGCAYAETLFDDEQIWLHQSASLQAGDIVDGNQGGGFSSMVSFDNVFSARRGNNARGQAADQFITGEFGSVGIGPVPRAGDTWVDEVGEVITFTRRDTLSTPEVFVTGQKVITGL